MIAPGVLVGVGAAAGAVLRYATNRGVDRFASDRRLPYGTLVVNVVGSFVLAWVTVAGVSAETLQVVGIGACGAYTTFSSFSVDTVRLWETEGSLVAGGYAAGTLLGALAGIGLAVAVAGP
jgi:CrcB protein